MKDEDIQYDCVHCDEYGFGHCAKHSGIQSCTCIDAACTGRCSDYELRREKQSVTIEGWVVREQYGAVELYQEKPTRFKDTWYSSDSYSLELPTDSFPDLKWSDEPKEVKITIEEV